MTTTSNSLKQKTHPLLIAIFILLALSGLYIARSFFVPFLFALILNYLFRPSINFLKKYSIRPMLGSTIILAFLMMILTFSVVGLIGPAQLWLEKMPSQMRRIESKVRSLVKPVQKVNQMASQMNKITAINQATSYERQVTIKQKSLFDIILSQAPDFIANAFIVIILLFFMLSYGESFPVKIAALFGPHQDQVLKIFQTTGYLVSNYLYTIGMINFGLGIFVAIAMFFIGLPNPILWGVMAFALNFIPYIGALAGVGLITLVSIISTGTSEWVYLAPIVYFILTSLEGNIITPMILGNRFSLNPIIIFLWVLIWSGMWGVAGTFICVPLLVMVKIYCDHIPQLNLVGKLIED